MRQRTITPENCRKFKPSEFIRSFLSDIESVEKSKKIMDMNSYGEFGMPRDCLPCLGAVACMNMGIPGSKFDSIGYYVSRLGDAIRRDSHYDVRRKISNLFDISIFEINIEPCIIVSGVFGMMDTKQKFDNIKALINYYADAFENIGY